MTQIKLNNLTLSFGNKIVLNSISYTFKNGITVIRGDSGAGKTTLLHAISGVYPNYTGTISIEPNKQIAYCMQEDLLFGNLTVYENMHLKYVACNQEMAKELLQITETLSLFGIESLQHNAVRTLSGGERQRLKMAMVALTNPEIILLDEPTAKLDEENVKKIIDIIEQAWKNRLVVIVSHDKLPFCTQVIEIHLKGGVFFE